MLDALASVVGVDKLASIIARLNVNDLGSLDAEWEVAILFALSRTGHLSYEENHGGHPMSI